MLRFVTALIAYIFLFIGICAVMLAVVNLIAIHVGSRDSFYFFGGVAIIAFVVSWLLLKISRKK